MQPENKPAKREPVEQPPKPKRDIPAEKPEREKDDLPGGGGSFEKR